MIKLPIGWPLRRNADGSLGLFAPKPKAGESRRTSHCFSPGTRSDSEEIMFKFFTHLIDEEKRQLEWRRQEIEIKLVQIANEDAVSPLRKYCEQESRNSMKAIYDAFRIAQPPVLVQGLHLELKEIQQRLEDLP